MDKNHQQEIEKMNDTLAFVISMTVVFPAIAGVLKIKKSREEYHPFIFIIWLGLFQEIISYVIILEKYKLATAIRSNLFIFLEFVLALWFFKNVLVNIKMIWFKTLFYLGMAVWLFENIVLNRLSSGYDYYFQVGYSLTLSLLSIEAINEVLIKEKKSLLKNALFLIAVGMVVFYTFSIFVEIEMHFATVGRKDFFRAIFAIQQWINCFVNLVFALAILWIPRKKNFTNPSF